MNPIINLLLFSMILEEIKKKINSEIKTKQFFDNSELSSTWHNLKFYLVKVILPSNKKKNQNKNFFRLFWNYSEFLIINYGSLPLMLQEMLQTAQGLVELRSEKVFLLHFIDIGKKLKNPPSNLIQQQRNFFPGFSKNQRYW